MTTNVIQGEVYVDAGAEATDDVDGCVSENVSTFGLRAIDTANPTMPDEGYLIEYNAFDSSGNPASNFAFRIVNVLCPTGSQLCTEEPPAYCSPLESCTGLGRASSSIEATEPAVVALVGPEHVEIKAGTQYAACAKPRMLDMVCDAGMTAVDPVDGDISSKVKACGANFQRYGLWACGLDTSQEGEYSIEFSVKDSFGRELILYRTLTVVPDCGLLERLCSSNTCSEDGICASDLVDSGGSGEDIFAALVTSGPTIKLNAGSTAVVFQKRYLVYAACEDGQVSTASKPCEPGATAVEPATGKSLDDRILACAPQHCIPMGCPGYEFSRIGISACRVDMAAPVGTTFNITFAVYDDATPAVWAWTWRTLAVVSPCATNEYECDGQCESLPCNQRAALPVVPDPAAPIMHAVHADLAPPNAPLVYIPYVGSFVAYGSHLLARPQRASLSPCTDEAHALASASDTAGSVCAVYATDVEDASSDLVINMVPFTDCTLGSSLAGNCTLCAPLVLNEQEVWPCPEGAYEFAFTAYDSDGMRSEPLMREVYIEREVGMVQSHMTLAAFRDSELLAQADAQTLSGATSAFWDAIKVATSDVLNYGSAGYARYTAFDVELAEPAAYFNELYGKWAAISICTVHVTTRHVGDYDDVPYMDTWYKNSTSAPTDSSVSSRRLHAALPTFSLNETAIAALSPIAAELNHVAQIMDWTSDGHIGVPVINAILGDAFGELMVPASDPSLVSATSIEFHEPTIESTLLPPPSEDTHKMATMQAAMAMMSASLEDMALGSQQGIGTDVRFHIHDEELELLVQEWLAEEGSSRQWKLQELYSVMLFFVEAITSQDGITSEEYAAVEGAVPTYNGAYIEATLQIEGILSDVPTFFTRHCNRRSITGRGVLWFHVDNFARRTVWGNSLANTDAMDAGSASSNAFGIGTARRMLYIPSKDHHDGGVGSDLHHAGLARDAAHTTDVIRGSGPGRASRADGRHDDGTLSHRRALQQQEDGDSVDPNNAFGGYPGSEDSLANWKDIWVREPREKMVIGGRMRRYVASDAIRSNYIDHGVILDQTRRDTIPVDCDKRFATLTNLCYVFPDWHPFGGRTIMEAQEDMGFGGNVGYGTNPVMTETGRMYNPTAEAFKHRYYNTSTDSGELDPNTRLPYAFFAEKSELPGGHSAVIQTELSRKRLLWILAYMSIGNWIDSYTDVLGAHTVTVNQQLGVLGFWRMKLNRHLAGSFLGWQRIEELPILFEHPWLLAWISVTTVLMLVWIGACSYVFLKAFRTQKGMATKSAGALLNIFRGKKGKKKHALKMRANRLLGQDDGLGKTLTKLSGSKAWPLDGLIALMMMVSLCCMTVVYIMEMHMDPTHQRVFSVYDDEHGNMVRPLLPAKIGGSAADQAHENRRMLMTTDAYPHEPIDTAVPRWPLDTNKNVLSAFGAHDSDMERSAHMYRIYMFSQAAIIPLLAIRALVAWSATRQLAFITISVLNSFAPILYFLMIMVVVLTMLAAMGVVVFGEMAEHFSHLGFSLVVFSGFVFKGEPDEEIYAAIMDPQVEQNPLSQSIAQLVWWTFPIILVLIPGDYVFATLRHELHQTRFVEASKILSDDAWDFKIGWRFWQGPSVSTVHTIVKTSTAIPKPRLDAMSFLNGVAKAVHVARAGTDEAENTRVTGLIDSAKEWLLRAKAHANDFNAGLDIDLGGHRKPGILAWKIKTEDGYLDAWKLRDALLCARKVTMQEMRAEDAHPAKHASFQSRLLALGGRLYAVMTFQNKLASATSSTPKPSSWRQLMRDDSARRRTSSAGGAKKTKSARSSVTPPWIWRQRMTDDSARGRTSPAGGAKKTKSARSSVTPPWMRTGAQARSAMRKRSPLGSPELVVNAPRLAAASPGMPISQSTHTHAKDALAQIDHPSHSGLNNESLSLPTPHGLVPHGEQGPGAWAPYQSGFGPEAVAEGTRRPSHAVAEGMLPDNAASESMLSAHGVARSTLPARSQTHAQHADAWHGKDPGHGTLLLTSPSSSGCQSAASPASGGTASSASMTEGHHSIASSSSCASRQACPEWAPRWVSWEDINDLTSLSASSSPRISTSFRNPALEPTCWRMHTVPVELHGGTMLPDEGRALTDCAPGSGLLESADVSSPASTCGFSSDSHIHFTPYSGVLGRSGSTICSASWHGWHHTDDSAREHALPSRVPGRVPAGPRGLFDGERAAAVPPCSGPVAEAGGASKASALQQAIQHRTMRAQAQACGGDSPDTLSVGGDRPQAQEQSRGWTAGLSSELYRGRDVDREARGDSTSPIEHVTTMDHIGDATPTARHRMRVDSAETTTATTSTSSVQRGGLILPLRTGRSFKRRSQGEPSRATKQRAHNLAGIPGAIDPSVTDKREPGTPLAAGARRIYSFTRNASSRLVSSGRFGAAGDADSQVTRAPSPVASGRKRLAKKMNEKSDVGPPDHPLLVWGSTASFTQRMPMFKVATPTHASKEYDVQDESTKYEHPTPVRGGRLAKARRREAMLTHALCVRRARHARGLWLRRLRGFGDMEEEGDFQHAPTGVITPADALTEAVAITLMLVEGIHKPEAVKATRKLWAGAGGKALMAKSVTAGQMGKPGACMLRGDSAGPNLLSKPRDAAAAGNAGHAIPTGKASPDELPGADSHFRKSSPDDMEGTGAQPKSMMDRLRANGKASPDELPGADSHFRKSSPDDMEGTGAQPKSMMDRLRANDTPVHRASKPSHRVPFLPSREPATGAATSLLAPPALRTPRPATPVDSHGPAADGRAVSFFVPRAKPPACVLQRNTSQQRELGKCMTQQRGLGKCMTQQQTHNARALQQVHLLSSEVASATAALRDACTTCERMAAQLAALGRMRAGMGTAVGLAELAQELGVRGRAGTKDLSLAWDEHVEKSDRDGANARSSVVLHLIDGTVEKLPISDDSVEPFLSPNPNGSRASPLSSDNATHGMYSTATHTAAAQREQAAADQGSVAGDESTADDTNAGHASSDESSDYASSSLDDDSSDDDSSDDDSSDDSRDAAAKQRRSQLKHTKAKRQKAAKKRRPASSEEGSPSEDSDAAPKRSSRGPKSKWKIKKVRDGSAKGGADGVKGGKSKNGRKRKGSSAGSKRKEEKAKKKKLKEDEKEQNKLGQSKQVKRETKSRSAKETRRERVRLAKQEK